MNPMISWGYALKHYFLYPPSIDHITNYWLVDGALWKRGSGYRTLRDTDNVYVWVRNSQYGSINWAANQVKINYTNKSYMVGTDGNDSFDANYYASAWQVDSSQLVNFVAGGGNDVMGGSARNDILWGGAGNDALLGYAGNDKLHGEEGDDELQGQDGHDWLAGGVARDRVYGWEGVVLYVDFTPRGSSSCRSRSQA